MMHGDSHASPNPFLYGVLHMNSFFPDFIYILCHFPVEAGLVVQGLFRRKIGRQPSNLQCPSLEIYTHCTLHIDSSFSDLEACGFHIQIRVTSSFKHNDVLRLRLKMITYLQAIAEGASAMTPLGTSTSRHRPCGNNGNNPFISK